MRTRPAVPLAFVLLAVLTSASIAQAARVPKPTPYDRYTLAGVSRIDSATVGFRAYAILPRRLPDRTVNGSPALRFGPIGSCRFNLSISAKVVERVPGETATARAAALLPAGSRYVNAQGTRASASWRVIRVRGSAKVRGIYLTPANVGTSLLLGTPITPVWLQVRAAANDHVEECHSGGPRYIGDSLAVAFGAMTGTAFALGLPRPVSPPPPSA